MAVGGSSSSGQAAVAPGIDQITVTGAVRYEELVEKDGVNPRGIAQVKFIEDVERACEKRTPKDWTDALQDLLAKYKYSESQIHQQKASVKQKLPEIESALGMVEHLMSKKEALVDPSETMDVKYQLAENVYASAEVPVKNDKIMLWLGANTMLEYSYDEAQKLLSTNFKNAKLSLVTIDEDMEFLRDQITTTEVNIARCHNLGVKLRAIDRAKQAELQAAASEAEENSAKD